MDNLESNLDPKGNETLLPENSGKKSGNPSQAKIIILSVVLSVLISSVFGAALGFVSGGFGQLLGAKISAEFPHLLGSRFKQKNQTNFPMANDTIKQQLVEEDSAIIDVVEKASPAVVSIVISKDIPKMQDSFSDPFGGMFDPFGGLFGDNNGSNSQGNDNDSDNQKTKIGGGTGFIITEDGMIVTNKHVVSDANAEYTIIMNDSKEYNAKVLARDPVNDIAILKIDGTGLPTLNFGDSDSLKIGQTVIAIGNSLGEFSNTVSKGIVSGLKRSVTAGDGFGDTERLTNIIQTDAAINPGNSGGPLLNVNGEVIGVNVAMAQGAQSIGFTLPSAQIEKVVEQVKSTGKISTPYLGIRYIPVTASIQKSIDLPYNYGVLVVRGNKVTDFAVIPGSPADKAGIIENDLILEINGTKIDDKNGLLELISKHNINDEITLKVWHKGELKDVKVRLDEKK